MDLNELAKEVHANAVSKGFWDNPKSNDSYLMLTVCEMAEAVEADRSSKVGVNMAIEFPLYLRVMSSALSQSDESCSESELFSKWYSSNIKGSVEEELADAFIRLLDLAGAEAVDVVIYSDCVASFRAEIEKLTFCDATYRICQILTSQSLLTGDIISIGISRLYALADKCAFDLNEHVNLKIRYNSTREKMHGKLY